MSEQKTCPFGRAAAGMIGAALEVISGVRGGLHITSKEFRRANEFARALAPCTPDCALWVPPADRRQGHCGLIASFAAAIIAHPLAICGECVSWDDEHCSQHDQTLPADNPACPQFERCEE